MNCKYSQMKKILVFISPGPVFRPKNITYQALYINLSKSFRGYIFTSSTTSNKITIADFKFNAIASKFSFIDNIRFFLFCIFNAIKLRIQKIKVDLVITYDPIKTGLIGLFFSKIVGAKFSPEVNGVYTSPAEWLDLHDNLKNRLKKFLIPIIIRFVLNNADGIKLLFKGQIDSIHGNYRAKVIKFFPCFVPTYEFANKRINERNEVLFVGFPFKRKGVDILIHAFKRIAPKYPNWKLKILGWFPNPEELNSIINQHPQIYHHPPVHYFEMPDHISSCAILVLPSRSEAMGRVLVEAMAAGKPRIGSNVDGIPTVINDGIDGLLFESENITDLSQKLDLLMSSKELRGKMGNAGITRVKEHFTENIYYKNVIDFYNKILMDS